MMNLANKIVVRNNGVYTRIVVIGFDGNIVMDKTVETHARLVNDNYIIDRETIAKLIGLRTEQLAIGFSNGNGSYSRRNGELYLINAEFERLTNEEIKESVLCKLGLEN